MRQPFLSGYWLAMGFTILRKKGKYITKNLVDFTKMNYFTEFYRTKQTSEYISFSGSHKDRPFPIAWSEFFMCSHQSLFNSVF